MTPAQRSLSLLRSVGLALLALAAAVLVRRLLLGGLGDRIVWVTFYPAVTIVALYGGWHSALLTAVGSCLFAVNGWPVSDHPLIADPGDWLGLSAFLFNCGLICFVAQSARRARSRAVAAKEQAEAASRAKSAFLASMSHELRTPLNAVLGFSSLMQTDPALSPEHRRTLGIINRSGAHLLGLINDVLDLARVEAGRDVLNARAFDLHALLEDVAALLRQRAQAQGLSLTLELGPQLERTVTADDGKLRQVLLNLVGNAVKFTQAGGVTLRASSETRGAGQALLRLEVADTGPGIAPADQQRIFEPFVQLRAEAAQQGTGLGLTLTRQLVTRLGGMVSVDSVLGRGSTFRVWLPVETTAAPLPALFEPVQLRLAPGQPEQRVLVVDDQPANEQLLRQLLERAGFSVQSASSGPAALALFQTWRPHFIWLDWRMPQMDGAEVVRRLRTLEGGREVKIVALSASVLADERERVLQAGVDDFEPKPIDFGRIFDCLARHLGVSYEAASAPAAAVRAPLDEGALAAMPSALKDELAAAMLSLDSGRILGVIRQVAANDPGLGQALEQRAGRLEYTAILTALKTPVGSAPTRGSAG